MTQVSAPRSIWHPIIRFAIGAIAVAVIRVIVGTLPMLESLLVQGLTLTALDLVRMALSTALLIIAFQCGREFAGNLQDLFPSFSDLGRMANYLVVYGVMAAAYSVFLPLAVSLLSSLLLIYQLTLFVLAGVPLLLFITLFFRNLGSLASLVGDAFRQALQPPRTARCSSCGSYLSAADQFCAHCGVRRELTTGTAGPQKG